MLLSKAAGESCTLHLMKGSPLRVIISFPSPIALFQEMLQGNT